MSKQVDSQQNQLLRNTTYVGKYACEQHYFTLKDCLKQVAESQGQMKQSRCDVLFEKIGDCILLAQSSSKEQTSMKRQATASK